MSVRGSKNKIILYIIAVCSILFIILLYHNASQRLEKVEKLYERCHLNEESLSVQLQVNLEYRVRLEKSLQQEKSDHSKIKEDLQNELKEERQAREKENLESINKFTALQQQYKFLQSQHEDLNSKCKQEKSSVELQMQNIKNEFNLIKENKENDLKLLKVKFSKLKKENAVLREENVKLLNQLKLLKSQKSVPSNKLSDRLSLNASVERNENVLQQLEIGDTLRPGATKSSTSANKAEQELFPTGNNFYMNTSTPMINPDAVMSQDKMLSAVPVVQPRHESLRVLPAYDNKENVGPKPDHFSKERVNVEVPVQGVLRAPDIMKDFGHVPAIHKYKESVKQGAEKNNNGGEVGDEGEPLMRNEKRLWREGGIEGMPFIRQPVKNEIPNNQVYQYQVEYDRRKEEGEDDDDVDPLDYHNGNEKNQQQEEKENIEGIHVQIPFEDKQESVMIQPK